MTASYLYVAMGLIAMLGVGGAVAVVLPVPTQRLHWLEPFVLTLLGAALIVGYLAINIE